MSANEESFLWEILVPTLRKNGKPYRTRFHRVFDAKVRSLSGGLTIVQPTKGQWVSPEGVVLAERMIPVRFMGTRAQMDEIVDFTLKYYEQQCVMCVKISDEVIFRYAKKKKQ
jgi:hypothetical protein